MVVFWGRRRLVDDVNNDKAASHQQSSYPERRFASPCLREEQDVRADHNELLRTEEPRDKKILAPTTNKNFEELWAELTQR